MRSKLVVFLFLFFIAPSFSQGDLEQKLVQLEAIKDQEKQLNVEIESLKLESIKQSLKKVGYPVSNQSIEILEHSAMTIGFDCKYKMASWVFHVLSPDVSFGTNTRSNDFRIEDKSSCASATEADYFLKTPKEDGTFSYDGFGFDRGHLAPSADFRWSASALSESYYYSNMTPQRPEFNRESWAELEFLLRTIVDNEKRSFYIITGPVLNENLPEIPKSVNKLKIPELHYKIIVDLSEDKPRGMAFVMPNKKCTERLSSYALSIDSVERLTGINFFPQLDSISELKIESLVDYTAWQTSKNTKDVEPLDALSLPKGVFNTQQASSKVGRKVSIIGKVVSSKFLPKSQSTFLNLDQSFPNQLFSITIWQDGRRNFSYKPEEELFGKYIVVTGTVTLDKNGIATINVEHEKQIEIVDE